jgi:hypothetical protein
MPRSVASPERARFTRFVGDWTGDEHVGESDFGGPCTALVRFRFRTVADGAFLAVDYVEDGGPGVIGHGVIGFDEKRGVYTLHWFDNSGVPPSAVGIAPVDGDELAFEANYGSHLGRTLFIAGDSELRFRVEMQKPDQPWRIVVDAVLAKIDSGATLEEARASSTLRSR